tara:strand:- start:3 stop:488 length:486 start_codon:yes stop_codon:yes gene_type:complete
VILIFRHRDDIRLGILQGTALHFSTDHKPMARCGLFLLWKSIPKVKREHSRKSLLQQMMDTALLPQAGLLMEPTWPFCEPAALVDRFQGYGPWQLMAEDRLKFTWTKQTRSGPWHGALISESTLQDAGPEKLACTLSVNQNEIRLSLSEKTPNGRNRVYGL